MKIVVSEAAAADLARLHAFLADKTAAAAARAVTALIAAVQSLDTFPERGRPAGTPNVREDVDYWIPALARGAKPRLLGRNDGHGCLALGIDSMKPIGSSG
jgi:plasmid stabilization system protein ParE